MLAGSLDFTSGDAFARSMGSINYFLIFALVIAFQCVFACDVRLRATQIDLAVVGAFVAVMFALSLVRFAMGIGLALSVAALLLVLQERRLGDSRQSDELKSAGRILLVVSLSIFWCKVAIMALGPLIVLLDTASVSLFLSIFWPEISQAGPQFTNPEGHSILIGGGCSVFASLSPGLMFAASAFLAKKPWISKTEWIALGLLFASLLMINAVRLSFLATSYERYVYWHDGEGVQILALIQTAVVILFTLLPFLRRRPSAVAMA